MQTDSYPPASCFGIPRSRRKSFALKALPAAAALLFSPAGWSIDIAGGAGLPQNGTVFSGTASGSVSGNQLTINQTSARAVVDWASFNIDAGKAVQILQPSAASAMLNRVTGDANPSQILGSLTAPGTVMLMNPNGVMFGQGATVNVGSLIATTGNIDVNNFINTGGAQITGAAGSITNQGSITAQGAGLVALVAPSVTNQGSITATGGTIALAGSTAATVSLNGGLYEFAVPTGATGTSVSNAAGASLDGATLRLAVGDAANLLSGVINLEGVQQASNAIVVNGHTVVLKSALQAPNVSGNASQVDVYSGARIQDAVNIAKTGSPGAGAAVDVHAGNYTEQVALNKANMTLTGLAGAKIVVPDTAGQLNGISITANNVTVTGMEIAGPVNQPYTSYAWGSGITRGIAVANGVTGFTISNNNIHDVRNGILIDGRNTGSVTGNRIENTKSAISVQYTDGNGIAIAGNSQGPAGNEWGVNLHLNGYWDGSSIHSNPIAAAPTLTWQQALLALSAGNGGWSVQDQGYTSSNRTHVNVATTGSGGAQGSLLTPLATIQAGVDAVVTGGTVNVAGGSYVQPTTLKVNKALTLAGAGQGATIIDARGVNGYGINVTADDVSLRDFTLYGPSANVATAYGIKVAPVGGASARLHNFSISNVTSRGAGRAELDLNGVDGAVIDHVTADGAPVGNDAGTTQGAGIQLTDSANVTITNSATRNNAWGGLALYQSNRFYNQQVSNITVAGNNSFTERNPVYMQDESASRDFGALSIAGFDFAVRNASTAGGNNQYTWLQASQQNAFDFAVNVGSSASSYVQGWNGAQATQDFFVGIGSLLGGGTQAMSVGNTLGQAGSGANIRVAGGTFAEDVVVNNPYNLYFSGSTLRSLALGSGASGSGISGTVTASGAGGIVFDAPVSLLGDTTLATQGADITLNGDIQNGGGVARALSLVAGTGASRGNVHMVSGGTEASALGQFAVVSNAFSLASTLWVKGYGIDALGNVALSNHTLRGQDASATNTLNAGGDVSGSTISLGAVQVTSGGDVSANVTASEVAVAAVGDVTGTTVSQGNVQVSSSTGDISGSISGANVIVQAQGDVNVVVVASGSASLAGDSVVANVVAPVVAVSAVGDAQLSGSSSQVTLNAASGTVSGNFGQVTNSGGGLVNVNGRPQGNQQLSSNAENNRVIPSGNSLAEGASADGTVLQLAQAGTLTAEGEPLMVRSSPSSAGEAIDNGQAVELDMSPKNEREKE
ncbi:filamentous hemagglutinin family N-terminal domain-containing protein [Polaromonas sp. YR568]|uniref:beta strand repeat-containing protein n=1 Tax=Polaromonas sp. YR568 TaxID=1855301 RepID=UPI0008E07E8C|nr:filamentous hemagglutinin N-terminal domain-containing protein [Polaromonas sp. YR568]SFU27672.1 filamentous hemagglutinin family N-terminal domain-containing protein [Polaromonas sp. YR568]